MRAVLGAALGALAILASACGPDCASYCRKLRDCQYIDNSSAAEDQCNTTCNETGSDHADTISCIINHGCTDLWNGHCSLEGQPNKP